MSHHSGHGLQLDRLEMDQTGPFHFRVAGGPRAGNRRTGTVPDISGTAPTIALAAVVRGTGSFGHFLGEITQRFLARKKIRLFCSTQFWLQRVVC